MINNKLDFFHLLQNKFSALPNNMQLTQMSSSVTTQKITMRKKQKNMISHESVQKQYSELLKNISNLSGIPNPKNCLSFPKIGKPLCQYLSPDPLNRQSPHQHIPPPSPHSNKPPIKHQPEDNSATAHQSDTSNQDNIIELIDDQILRKTWAKINKKQSDHQQQHHIVQYLQKNRKNKDDIKCTHFQIQQYQQLLQRFKTKIKKSLGQLSINIIDHHNRNQIKSVLLEQEMALVRERQKKQLQLAELQLEKSRKIKFIQLYNNYNGIQSNYIPNQLLKVLMKNRQYKSQEKKSYRLPNANHNKILKLMKMHIKNPVEQKHYQSLPSIR